MSRMHPLDPFEVTLRGSHLIEAAAGTGKTWTIAALYLRLILEADVIIMLAALVGPQGGDGLLEGAGV